MLIGRKPEGGKRVRSATMLMKSCKSPAYLSAYQQVEGGFLLQPNGHVNQHMLSLGAGRRAGENRRRPPGSFYCGNGKFTLALSHSAFRKVHESY